MEIFSDIYSWAIQFGYFIVALLIVLSVHEAAHATVAYWLGDNTARNEGRMTLNPIAHLDLFGSLIFLVTQTIGWGKPVPVDPRNFEHPVRDSALTALAGPVSNFLLSFLLAIPMRYLGEHIPLFLGTLLWTTFHVSIFLGLFNLLPFPPLDGSKIIGLFVPRRYHEQYEEYLDNGVKYFVAVILIDSFILPDFFGFSFFGSLISKAHEWVSALLLLGI